MNRVLILSAAAAAALLAAGRPAPAAFTAGDLSKFNFISIGDVANLNSDVQGRVLIGGTLSDNNFTFGGQIGNVTNGAPMFSGAPINGVFGTLGSGVSNLNTNGLPSSTVVYGAKVGGGSVTNATQNTAATNFFTTGLAATLTDLSSAYAALTTNGTVDQADRNQIKFTSTTTGPVAVFSIDANFFASSGTITQLNLGSATTAIINVTGAGAINASSGLNFFQNFNNSANILFNFGGITALNGINNLGASVLAPNAVLNTNATLRGGIYVKSVTNVGEIDLAQSLGTFVGGYTGFVPPPPTPPPPVVPEPASVLSLGIAMSSLGLVGWHRRRRRCR